jgi:hypothetical protein
MSCHTNYFSRFTLVIVIGLVSFRILASALWLDFVVMTKVLIPLMTIQRHKYSDDIAKLICTHLDISN